MQKLDLEKPLQQMLDAFASYPVDLIQIAFDGGAVAIRLLRKVKNGGFDELDIEALELHPQHRKSFRKSNSGFQDYFDVDPLTLRPLVEAVAWGFMRRHFPSWDVNSGDGAILINPKKDCISIDLRLRIVDNYGHNAHGGGLPLRPTSKASPWPLDHSGRH